MLKDRQIDELAKIFVNMADSVKAFFDNAETQKEYREWYLKKYGRLPEVE